MELWDAYDAHLNVIGGQVLVRGKKIPKGVYHLVSEVIMRHQDGTYLLTQRNSKKSWWDVGSDCWWFSFARQKSLRVCQTRIA